jgi:uroporphyrinogen-III synthase
MEPSISQVALLHRISSIVSSARTLDEMLSEIVEITIQVTCSDACLIYLLDVAAGEIELRATQVQHTGDAIAPVRIQLGDRVRGWAAEHKSVVAVSANASEDHRFNGFHKVPENSYEAFLSVPLMGSGNVVGVINVHHRERHDYSPEEIALVSFIGEQIGEAVVKTHLVDENAHLLGEIQMMKRRLEERKLVERAKGLLQKRHGLTEEQAYLRLRNESRRLRRPMRDLAEAIILAEDLTRKSGFQSAAAESGAA